MNIALCDDDPQALAFLQNAVSANSPLEMAPLHLFSFSSGTAFLASRDAFDIVFMDIYLGAEDGMMIAKKYLENHRAVFVFTTSSREHAIQAYQVGAIHYLVKPFALEEVACAMRRCQDQLHRTHQKKVSIGNLRRNTSLFQRDIHYIEVFDKISVIHTIQGEIETNTSLEALYERLDHSCFMRAQRSYIVNMEYIDSLTADRVTLRDGTEIILSRLNRTQLRQQYQNYMFTLAREGEP